MLNEIKERLTVEILQTFCRENGLKLSGLKDEIIDRIIEECKGNPITLQKFQRFVFEKLKYGKNNITIINDIGVSSESNLNTVELIKRTLQSKDLNNENFNHLLELKHDYTDNGLTPVYQEIVQFEDDPLINWGFLATNTNSNNIKVFNFVFVTVDLKESKIFCRVSHRGLSNFELQSTLFSINDKYTNWLKSLFTFRVLDVDYMKGVIYSIYKEMTDIVEDKFTPVIAKYEELVQNLIINFSADNNYNIQSDALHLEGRMKSNLLRILIMNSGNAFEEFYTSELGLVESIYFFDRTGASVSAKSNDNDENLNTYEIYFDVKDTLDNNRKIQRIRFFWFLTFNGTIKKIHVKLEIHKNFYVIHIIGKNLEKEVFDSVYSRIREYQEE